MVKHWNFMKFQRLFLSNNSSNRWDIYDILIQ